MAPVKKYPIGTEVRIKDPGNQPSNWNSEMASLPGRVSTIARNDIPSGSYRYKLDDWPWAWRYCDLEPLSSLKPEPNMAFRIKKHAL